MVTPEEIEWAYWEYTYAVAAITDESTDSDHQEVANLHRRFLTLQNESRPDVGVK